MEKNLKRVYIYLCIIESLCYILESNTTLKISRTSIRKEQNTYYSHVHRHRYSENYEKISIIWCPLTSIQSLSRVWLFVTPWTQHARPPCPSPTPGVTQTHVHWVSDAIQPSHPLLSPSPPSFNLSQHQGLFKWVSPSSLYLSNPIFW